MIKSNAFRDRFFADPSFSEFIVKGLARQFFGDEVSKATLEDVVMMQRDTLGILQTLPPDDIAFTHFFNSEKALRKLAVSMYLSSGEEKRLGLLIDDIPVGPMRKDIVDACEIYDLPMIEHTRHGGNVRTDLVLDLTGKDLDSPEFLESIEMIRSVVTPPKQHDRRPMLSLQLIDCYVSTKTA